MKKLLLLCLTLFMAFHSPAQPAQWLKKVNHFATEYVGTMAYVPDSAGVEASLWTFTFGELPAPPGGSSSSTFENRLMAFQESNGAILFNKLVTWGRIFDMTFDSSANEVILVLSGVSNNPLAPVSIGTDTFRILPNAVPPALPCNKFAVVRYSRTGTLIGFSLLDYPCKEEDGMDYAYGTLCAINTIQNKIALSFQAFGKLAPPVHTITFAGESRDVSADSAYITVFQWDYDGTQQQMHLFAQPRSNALRSKAAHMVYDTAGNIYLAGPMKSDIAFDTLTVARGMDRDPSFLARLRPDGTVAAARRIQPGTEGSILKGIAYNDHSHRLYLAGDWRNHLTLDSMPVVTNMDSIWSSATFVAAMDTNFAITNLMTLREGDTLNVLQGIVQLLDLEVDSRGHLLATGVFTDSFLINNTLYHALSVPDPSYDATDVLVVDFKPDLSLDTLYLSEGSGSETGWRVVAGKPA